MTSLRLKTFTAAVASGGGEMLTRVIAVALSIMTARLLEPVQVGLLGLAAIIIGLISMGGYYVEIAAVAARGDDPNERVALAASVVRLCSVALLVAVLIIGFPFFGSRVAADAAGAAQLRQITFVFSLTLLFELISGYPSIVLQRRLDLTALAITQPVQPIVAIATAAWLMVHGSGPIGVAWGNVAGSAAVAMLLWVRLLFRGAQWTGWPSVSTLRTTLRGAGAMFVGLFGGYLSERFDNLLVAGSIGPRAMSFYSMAWNASHTPANVFSRAMNFVLVPTLAHLKDDGARVERALREALRYSYVLLAPVCALFVVAAPELIVFILGTKWLPAATPLRIMSVSVLAAPVLFASTALLVGTGRAQWTGISTAIHLVVLALIIPPMARAGGVRGAALGELAAVMLLTVTVVTTAHLVTGRIDRTTLSAPFLPLCAAGAAAAASWFLTTALQGVVLRLFVHSFLIGLLYFALLYLVARETHLDGLVSLLRGMFSRRAPVVESAASTLTIINA